jgi:hypothetical protein
MRDSERATAPLPKPHRPRVARSAEIRVNPRLVPARARNEPRLPRREVPSDVKLRLPEPVRRKRQWWLDP